MTQLSFKREVITTLFAAIVLTGIYINLEIMMKHFSNEVTAFLPISHRNHLHKGKQEIREFFKLLLDRVKASGVSNMGLVPEDILIQPIGDDAAIVTFKIVRDSILRRTIVFKKTGAHWRIYHLHASSAPL